MQLDSDSDEEFVEEGVKLPFEIFDTKQPLERKDVDSLTNIPQYPEFKETTSVCQTYVVGVQIQMSKLIVSYEKHEKGVVTHPTSVNVDSFLCRNPDGCYTPLRIVLEHMKDMAFKHESA